MVQIKKSSTKQIQEEDFLCLICTTQYATMDPKLEMVEIVHKIGQSVCFFSDGCWNQSPERMKKNRL